MRFILTYILVLVSFVVVGQAPPMSLGGPQGINVKRILAQDWMSVPIMTDTPAAPLTGSGWPGRGYIVFVARTDSACVGCPPSDTSLWEYTGKRWKRIGADYLTKLVYGADVSKHPTISRRYVVTSYGAFINGDWVRNPLSSNVNVASKTADSTSRIDAIVIRRTGPGTSSIVAKTGEAKLIPFKPSISSEEIELSTIYFPPFDTVPRFIPVATGVTSVFRIPGRDSIYYSIDTTTFAIKDSIGISTSSNGLTTSGSNVKLGGSLIENTNIGVTSNRFNIFSGSDTTRFFTNGNVSVGGTATDSTYKFNVNGTTRVGGILYLQPQTPSTSAVIVNQNSIDGNIVWGGSSLSLNASIGIRNTIISPAGTFSNLTGSSNTIIGRNAPSLTSGSNNILLGTNAGSSLTTGSNNTIIGFGDGHNYSSATNNSIHIVAGGGYESNRGDSVLLGLSGNYAFIGGGFNSGGFVNDFYFGAGNRVRLPNLTHVNFYAPSGFPTKADTIGSNFTINAGRGTGQGLGGSVIFRTSDTVATGNTLQTLTERVRITPRGNMLVGTSADSLFRLDVNGRVRLRDTLTLSTTPVTADTSTNDLLVINSSNGQVRRYTGDWYSVPLSGSATLDFGNTSAQNSADLTITVTGAASGDVVSLGVPNGSVNANTCFTAWVSATDTVTVRFNNYSSGAVDPASGTFKIKVLK